MPRLIKQYSIPRGTVAVYVVGRLILGKASFHNPTRLQADNLPDGENLSSRQDVSSGPTLWQRGQKNSLRMHEKRIPAKGKACKMSQDRYIICETQENP